jgi:hypothetical protein
MIERRKLQIDSRTLFADAPRETEMQATGLPCCKYP